ncbi:MAG: Uma2 family endonuclease [Bacteroidota bacterium]
MIILEERQTITPLEYLEREKRKSKEEGRSEYFDGVIYDMPMVSNEHDLITGNLFGHFWTHVRPKGYRITTSDLRSKISETKYALPDLTVVKGKAIFSPDEFDNLLNPHLIIEVLSDSTAWKDRGIKFRAYQKLESLQEYIMVSQYEYSVECYYRDETGKWVIGEYYSKPDDVVKFKSIPFELTVKDIYEGVEF